jgi:hypothetical protein
MTLPQGWRFRVTWLGKVVLQRSNRVPAFGPGAFYFKWEDATSTDLDALCRASQGEMK